jgi:hypothetical protein
VVDGAWLLSARPHLLIACTGSGGCIQLRGSERCAISAAAPKLLKKTDVLGKPEECEKASQV